MANQLRELGEFVVFENPALNNLHDTGLMVAHQASPVAQIRDAGLMILHDAEAPDPQSSLMEAGLMILFSGPGSRNKNLIQGTESIIFPKLQGAKQKRFSR